MSGNPSSTGSPASTSSIRKKRNFKGLSLPQKSASEAASGGPGGAAGAAADEARSTSRAEVPADITHQLSELEIGVELKLDLRAEDLQTLKELGSGNGGTVSKVLYLPTNKIMAKKVVLVEGKTTIRKQIVRELQVLHDCNSMHIISFYGAFMGEGDVSICMEYMDKGSLDAIYKANGPIALGVVGKITHAVLSGLIYLYETHRIIHRDVKPSNILVNSQGQIKICDFGVSGQLINSIANTFVGTSSYMSPERIQGAMYSVQSDVWSLGLTLMELALGRFPFPPEGKPLSIIFELLEYIVHEPAPKLPPGEFPPVFESFISSTLEKDPAKRPTPAELAKHEFATEAAREQVDLEVWAKSLK